MNEVDSFNMKKFIRKIVFKLLFNKDEVYRIRDIYSYLYQLESIWRDPNDSCNKFCLDVACCRKFLLENFIDTSDEGHSVDNDVRDHIWNHRYSDTYNEFAEKMKKKYQNDEPDIDCGGILKIKF